MVTVEDITQRKQIEEKLKNLNEKLEVKVEAHTAQLQHTQARLKQLTDNVPGMIYEYHEKPEFNQNCLTHFLQPKKLVKERDWVYLSATKL